MDEVTLGFVQALEFFFEIGGVKIEVDGSGYVPGLELLRGANVEHDIGARVTESGKFLHAHVAPRVGAC